MLSHLARSKKFLIVLQLRAVRPMSVVPWKERIESSIAASRKIRGGNYVQLATCDSDGAPRVRTVVFRGFACVSRVAR